MPASCVSSMPSASGLCCNWRVAEQVTKIASGQQQHSCSKNFAVLVAHKFILLVFENTVTQSQTTHALKAHGCKPQSIAVDMVLRSCNQSVHVQIICWLQACGTQTVTWYKSSYSKTKPSLWSKSLHLPVHGQPPGQRQACTYGPSFVVHARVNIIACCAAYAILSAAWLW